MQSATPWRRPRFQQSSPPTPYTSGTAHDSVRAAESFAREGVGPTKEPGHVFPAVADGVHRKACGRNVPLLSIRHITRTQGRHPGRTLCSRQWANVMTARTRERRPSSTNGCDHRVLTEEFSSTNVKNPASGNPGLANVAVTGHRSLISVLLCCEHRAGTLIAGRELQSIARNEWQTPQRSGQEKQSSR